MQLSHNYIHITPFLSLPALPSSHPSRWSQSTQLGSQCYTVTSHQLSILNMVVYICRWYFLCSFHSFFPPQCPQVHVLYLHLYPFPVNRFLNTIFLDSMCVSHSVLSELHDPMDCSLPGCSVHGIRQEKILEWVAIPFSRASSWPKDPTRIFCTAGRFFMVWATREAQQTLNCQVSS